MQWQFTSCILLYILGSVVALVTAWMAWSQRQRPGVRSLSGAMLAVAAWLFCGALEVAANTWPVKFAFAVAGHITAVAAVLWMVFFVIEYFGYASWLTPARRWLLGVPGLALIGLSATNSWHNWIWSGLVAGPVGSYQLIYLYGPAYYPLLAYLCLLALAAVGLIARVSARRRGRDRRRAVLIAFSLALPLASSVLYWALPQYVLALDLLPVGFAIAGLLILVIVFQDVEEQIAKSSAELRTTIATLQNAIAAREHAEAMLRHAEVERQQLEVDRLRSELLANVSHELRTPLGLILLTSTMLIDQDARMDHATRVGFLQDIEAETQKLRELVDNLLDLTRLRSGRIRLNCHLTDLTQLTQETAARLAPQLSDHPIAIEMPAEPLRAWADPARIEQVLRNLLVNAARYSLPGAPITIHGVKRANDVLLGVSDKGIGIASDDLVHVFERFYRAKNALTQQTRGAGLGLSICKSLVEAHGGQIWAESQPGAGSTFFFTAPLDERNPQEFR